MSDLPAQVEINQVASKFKQDHIRTVTINMEQELFDQGLADRLAESLGGPCYRLDQLRAEALYATVRQELDS